MTLDDKSAREIGFAVATSNARKLLDTLPGERFDHDSPSSESPFMRAAFDELVERLDSKQQRICPHLVDIDVGYVNHWSKHLLLCSRCTVMHSFLHALVDDPASGDSTCDACTDEITDGLSPVMVACGPIIYSFAFCSTCADLIKAGLL